MTEWIRIVGGRVIDPARNVDDVRDVWIRDGSIVEPPGDELPNGSVRVIDARGDVVMPGGVDVHCHVAGPKVNAARMMRPEEARDRPRVDRTDRLRSGVGGGLPTSFAVSARYAGLGYTTAIDAAVPPFGARHVLREFQDIPILDKAFLVLVGNNHYVMDRIREGAADRLRDYVAWILRATRAYGLKVVNPGGIEQWKEGRGNVGGLDDRVDGFEVSPRQILQGLATAADDLNLPHPIHVHGPSLGLPGNAAVTMDLLRALDGRRAHLAHIQFHSYGGSIHDGQPMVSEVAALADYVNEHPRISLDVGQVVFGETTALTADGAVGQYLHKIHGRKWYSHDVERETGCGVVPITYQDTNAIHALQWAIGLEWFLRVDDPWRVALSTDHPNGGSFLAYPEIIALLMSRNLRDEMLKRLPARVRERSGLHELDREYTLSEIAIVSRAGPARILGLDRKGHLGPGADADVTIYRPDDDRRRMFELPRVVIQRGRLVVDDFTIQKMPDGRTLFTERDFDPAEEHAIADWFNRHATTRFHQFAATEADLHDDQDDGA